jgi:hypothetical protein
LQPAGIGGLAAAATASTMAPAAATASTDNTNTTSGNQTQEASSPPNATSTTTTTTTSEPMEKLTDGGTYKVKMSWSPATIDSKTPTTFNIEFLDPKTGQKIDNVQYDFMIMPAEDPETMITHRAFKIAQNGSAQQSFTFKDENVGSVMVRVSNINNSGELVDFPITVT